MFREIEKALCLSEEGDLWDGSDQLLCFMRETQYCVRARKGGFGMVVTDYYVS